MSFLCSANSPCEEKSLKHDVNGFAQLHFHLLPHIGPEKFRKCGRSGAFNVLEPGLIVVDGHAIFRLFFARRTHFQLFDVIG